MITNKIEFVMIPNKTKSQNSICYEVVQNALFKNHFTIHFTEHLNELSNYFWYYLVLSIIFGTRSIIVLSQSKTSNAFHS